MSIQKTNWGHIEWFNLQSVEETNLGMNVGIVTLDVGAHQFPHVHYDTQTVYIIEGKGKTIINDKEILISPGSLFVWKAGITHEVFNTGDVPLRHLLVSNPAGTEKVQNKGIKIDKMQNSIKSFSGYNKLYVAIEAIRTQFLETINYSYSIYDSENKVAKRSQHFPIDCVKNCRKELNAKENPCLLDNVSIDVQKECSFYCKYGMQVFQSPIFYENEYLGYIQGGYIPVSELKSDSNIYDSPASALVGIQSILRKIAKAITNYCEFDEFRKELEIKDQLISTSKESQRELIENLHEAEYNMTDLKINNHFLFNTLNSMASMALDAGTIPLYQSIISLSRMFSHRYTSSGVRLIPLKEEVNYVKAYLDLQKLRFQDTLRINLTIKKKEILDYLVPCNFLQPIVENAFIHGFSTLIDKEIDINIGIKKNALIIRVRNNGVILDNETCYSINQGMKSESSHGLSMVYNKLENIYKDRFSMFIADVNRRYMEVTVCVPIIDNPVTEGEIL